MIATMTGAGLRQKLCDNRRFFTLATGEIKQRLGHPDAIAILPRWCKRTGRDVLVFTYKTDEGEASVFGAVGFLNGEETLFEGWVILVDNTAAERRVQVHGTPGALDVQQTLFEDWAIISEEPSVESSGAGRVVGDGQGPQRATESFAGPTLFDGLVES